MCKIIDALNTLSKLHSNLSEKVNTVMNCEIFGASNALMILFFMNKYKDLTKVAEATGNDQSFIMFNCNNLARSGLLQMKSSLKKGLVTFALTKEGEIFLEENSEKIKYFEKFSQMFNEINALSNTINSIDVDSFKVEDEFMKEEEEHNDQFMVI